MLRDGATYPSMPSLAGALAFTGRLIPADGLARVTVTDTSLKVSWTWTIRAGRASAKRWKELGIPPVVWHWAPPSGGPATVAFPQSPEFRRPVLLMALARDVTVEVRRDRQSFTAFRVERPRSPFTAVTTSPGPACQCHPSHHQRRPMSDLRHEVLDPDAMLCDLTPHVTVFRNQDPRVTPSFGHPQSILAAMGTPYVLVSGTEEPVPIEADDLGRIADRMAGSLGYVSKRILPPGLLIVPQPTGVVIQSWEGRFQVQVTIKDPDKPAAYAYSARCQGSVSLIVIQHDDNVTVTAQAGPNAVARATFIYARKVPHDAVPRQGAHLDLDPKTYHRHELPDRTGFLSVLQLMIEVPLSFVPVIGDLYELGQLAFMMATGRDFWGTRVTSNEIILYGTLSAVSVGATAYVRMGRSSARLSQELARIEGLTTDLRRMVDDVDGPARPGSLLKRLKSLPEPQQEKLVKMLEAAAANPRAAAATLAKGVQDVLQETKQASKQAEDLLDLDVHALFTEDMASFANSMLRWEYDDYLVRVARISKDPKAPLDWLLATKREWVHAYLTAHLGDDYRTVVKAAHGRLPNQVTLTPAMLGHYDKVARMGINQYNTMQNQVRKVSGFGYLFELDHIIEQRFIRRLREWTEAVPEYLAFQAFLVPKNAAVAAQMIRVDPSSHVIRYVHQAKTDIMRTLIPHGSESLFSVQQIADATLFTLKSLDAHTYVKTISVLEEDFRFLAEALGQKMPRLRPWDELTEDLFTAANGWPQAR
ncbi:hypothetical protein NLX85_19725 [Micromonospora sp. A3M-1-15]|uniref:hypothetical protein n=1 Tax=Micromonospora sp. A3M-1-15 TaxID=2962035 RepID=UPI0020B7C9FC|nr:hypothetical protein [Micromonospora sp. A3M-1-15]MCP3785595.1 hypothetical protein [Micromonospora sp. A3M-1-15]